MPITQDRMIALLEAAQDFEDTFDRTLRDIRHHIHSFQSGAISGDEFISRLTYLTQGKINLLQHHESITTIALEKAHFKPSRIRQNERIANLQRNKRRASGIMPSQTESYQQRLEREVREELEQPHVPQSQTQQSRLTRPQLQKLDPDNQMTPEDIQRVLDNLDKAHGVKRDKPVEDVIDFEEAGEGFVGLAGDDEE